MGVLEMEELFHEHNIPNGGYTIKECMVEEVDAREEFDIVIAEGFLHSIDNASGIIKSCLGL